MSILLKKLQRKFAFDVTRSFKKYIDFARWRVIY